MTGHHRFLHTHHGKSFFARVWVEVHDHGWDEIVDALPDLVNSEAGEFNRHSAPTWVAAALNGIGQALNHARQTGLLGAVCRLELTRLIGSVLDTRDDVVRCAAALAAWDGLGLPGPGPEAEFNGQSWELQFPAAILGSAEGITP